MNLEFSFGQFFLFSNPNEYQKQESTLSVSKERNRFKGMVWEEYDAVHQKYMEISERYTYIPIYTCTLLVVFSRSFLDAASPRFLLRILGLVLVCRRSAYTRAYIYLIAFANSQVRNRK